MAAVLSSTQWMGEDEGGEGLVSQTRTVVSVRVSERATGGDVKGQCKFRELKGKTGTGLGKGEGRRLTSIDFTTEDKS